MTTMATGLSKLVGVGAMAALAVACADELADGAGEMLRDAGEVLADAGAALGDAGDAQAQSEDGGAAPLERKPQTVEVACEERYEKTVTVDDGSDGPGTRYTLQIVNYYATLRVDTSDLTGVDAIACDKESLAVAALPPDPCKQQNASCVGSAEPLEPTRCASLNAAIGDGFVRVQCGESRMSTPLRGGFVENIQRSEHTRYKSVRFTVRH